MNNSLGRITIPTDVCISNWSVTSNIFTLFAFPRFQSTTLIFFALEWEKKKRLKKKTNIVGASETNWWFRPSRGAFRFKIVFPLSEIPIFPRSKRSADTILVRGNDHLTMPLCPQEWRQRRIFLVLSPRGEGGEAQKTSKNLVEKSTRRWCRNRV